MTQHHFGEVARLSAFFQEQFTQVYVVQIHRDISQDSCPLWWLSYSFTNNIGNDQGVALVQASPFLELRQDEEGGVVRFGHLYLVPLGIPMECVATRHILNEEVGIGDRNLGSSLPQVPRASLDLLGSTGHGLESLFSADRVLASTWNTDIPKADACVFCDAGNPC